MKKITQFFLEGESPTLTSVVAEFPTRNFFFIISYNCKSKLNHMFLSFLFSNFNRRKKVCINHWNLMNDRYYSKIALQQNIKLIVWLKSLKNTSEEVQSQQSCWPITCNFSKNRTLSQAYFNWFSPDLKQLFCRGSPIGCF